MRPAAVLKATEPKREEHAAIGKKISGPVPDKQYPGFDRKGWSTEMITFAKHTDPQWLGYEGLGATFTIDLGQATTLRQLSVDTLRSTTTEGLPADPDRVFRVGRREGLPPDWDGQEHWERQANQA